MTAFEILDRMTSEEMTLWLAYDRMKAAHHTLDDRRFAVHMAKLDILAGHKKVDTSKYLPTTTDKPRRPKTRAELITMFQCIAASGGGLMAPKGATDGE